MFLVDTVSVGILSFGFSAGFVVVLYRDIITRGDLSASSHTWLSVLGGDVRDSRPEIKSSRSESTVDGGKRCHSGAEWPVVRMPPPEAAVRR